MNITFNINININRWNIVNRYTMQKKKKSLNAKAQSLGESKSVDILYAVEVINLKLRFKVHISYKPWVKQKEKPIINRKKRKEWKQTTAATNQ